MPTCNVFQKNLIRFISLKKFLFFDQKIKIMDLKAVIENNLINHLIVSDYDESSFENIELCLGIDEGL